MSEETVFPPFRVSPAAVSQIEAVGGSVRIDISAGGCCGRRYVFTADQPDADDEVFGCTGATLALRVAWPRAAWLPVVCAYAVGLKGRVNPDLTARDADTLGRQVSDAIRQIRPMRDGRSRPSTRSA
jgi:hypothetical protein